jgi:hypothetical protein
MFVTSRGNSPLRPTRLILIPFQWLRICVQHYNDRSTIIRSPLQNHDDKATTDLQVPAKGRNRIIVQFSRNTAAEYETMDCVEPMLESACGLQDSRLQDIGKRWFGPKQAARSLARSYRDACCSGHSSPYYACPLPMASYAE